MHIERHLARLLYSHDCVIVPGFGGFICDFTPSAVDPARHLVYPPAKRLAFNAALKKNDGLLVSYIASAEQIGYADAFRRVEEFTREIMRRLERQKRLILEQVGELYFDKRRNIHFRPDPGGNFLVDSFGLPPVQAHPMREGRHTPAKSIKPRTATVVRLHGRDVRRALELLPAAAMLVLMLMLPALAPRINTVLSDLNPFAREEAVPARPAFTPPVVTPAPVATEKHDAEIPVAALPEEEGTDTVAGAVATETDKELEKVTDEAETEVSGAAEAEDETVSKPVPPAAVESEGPYFIIAGCFRVEENAGRLNKKLQMLGFPSQNLGPNAAGLTMISASAHATLAEAQSALPRVRSEVIATAWIFRRPR